MKVVSITEANQRFSSLIRDLEAGGEGYLIQRRGKVVAKLVPGTSDKMDDPKWRAAYERMSKDFKTGVDLGGMRVDRDELYDR